MPRGASPGERRGGRTKGKPNKSTLERMALAERTAAVSAEIERVGGLLETPEQIAAVRAKVQRLGKEILADYANVLTGMAAAVQPKQGAENTAESYGLFLRLSELAIYAADKAAAFQSPRLAAVMVGQAQTRRIEITGGLPSASSPPALTDDEYVRAMKVVDGKVIDGHVERNATGQPAGLPSKASPVLSGN